LDLPVLEGEKTLKEYFGGATIRLGDRKLLFFDVQTSEQFLRTANDANTALDHIAVKSVDVSLNPIIAFSADPAVEVAVKAYRLGRYRFPVQLDALWD
jgi:hypothetical protein